MTRTGNDQVVEGAALAARVVAIGSSLLYLLIFLIGLSASTLLFDAQSDGFFSEVGSVLFFTSDEGLGQLVYRLPVVTLVLLTLVVASVSIIRRSSSLDLGLVLALSFTAGTIFVFCGITADQLVSYGQDYSRAFWPFIASAALLGLFFLSLALLLPSLLISRMTGESGRPDSH